MALSTRDYFDLVSRHLPPSLVSPRHVETLARVAGHLPPSSNFGFECRLGEQDATADLLVAVLPSDGSRAAWAGENSRTARPTPPTTDSSAWSSALDFLGAWHREAALATVHDAWLEFDLPAGELAGPESALPEPSLFFGFHPDSGRAEPSFSLDLVERLRGRALPAESRRAIEVCFAALPPHGVIFQVGVMLARSIDGVRLCTRRLGPAEIVAYLDAVGWPGSHGEIRATLDGLAEHVDSVHLDLSVSSAVEPTIGLECVVQGGASARPRARAFLDRLVEQGQCLSAKAAGLFEWLGYSTEETDGARWPSHLVAAARAMDADVVSTFARTLNHVKLGLGPDGPKGAKAYLGVRHFWARRPAGVGA